MYRLQVLSAPTSVRGEAARGEPERDAALVAEWFAAFHAEALPSDPVEDWDDRARVRLAAGEVHLWREAGRPVSLAAVSPAAGGVARIGPVYTLPAARRHGYGSAVTAAATAAALAAGALQVVLYADLDNPTANSIYQGIGFKADHDTLTVVFT